MNKEQVLALIFSDEGAGTVSSDESEDEVEYNRYYDEESGSSDCEEEQESPVLTTPQTVDQQSTFFSSAIHTVQETHVCFDFVSTVAVGSQLVRSATLLLTPLTANVTNSQTKVDEIALFGKNKYPWYTTSSVTDSYHSNRSKLTSACERLLADDRPVRVLKDPA